MFLLDREQFKRKYELKARGVRNFREGSFQKEASMINVFRKTVLLLLVFSFTLYAGCSSDDSDVNQANQLLEKAYQSYMDGDPSQALTEVNSSLEHAVTSEALAFKSQVEYVLGDKTAAYGTLSTFEALYPDNGEDDLLRAYFLSMDFGDCDQILSNMETALNEDYADMSCESYWQMVETEGNFSYFEDSCPTQYATLEEMKIECPSEGTLGACKQNKTRFGKKWYGPELWLNHEATSITGDITKVTAIIMPFVPIPAPAKVVLAGFIVGRSLEIKYIEKKEAAVLFCTGHGQILVLVCHTFWPYSGRRRRTDV
jgi:hypothetical protein